MEEHNADNNRNKAFTSENSMSSSSVEECIETQIEISINSIENVIRNESFLIKIVVEHEDRVLGESHSIIINASYKSRPKVYPINFIVSLPYIPNNTKCITQLVSSPILITIYEVLEDNGVSKQRSEDLCKEKIQEKSRASSSSDHKILGICNIDVLPIVLGEITYDEKLLLEVPSYTWDNNIVSWENLIKISVTLQQDESRLVMKDMEFNIFNITVESIYNLPTSFTKDMNYECGTVLHSDIKESSIVFENGKWTEFRNLENTKSWRTLQNVNSRARLSEHKISVDYNIVNNDFKQFDLKAATKHNNKRIEWNSMHRSFLNEEDINNLRERLKKCSYWPFEIMVTESQSNREAKNLQNTAKVIYQCYVDTNELLFPGRKKTRVLAQLHLQNLSDMKEKTGLEINIFNSDILEEPKSRSASQSSASSVPLFTENGDPVLILIEFDFYRPLFPARILEDFLEATDILKKKPKPSGLLYSYTPQLAYDQYVKTIKQIADIMGESYRDFVEHCDCDYTEKSSDISSETIKSKCQVDPNNLCKYSASSSITNQNTSCPYLYLQDELSRFRQFLHETGQYATIRTTLKNKIINLLDQKFPMNSAARFSIENQDFIAACYTYLTEEMHSALNSKLDVRLDEEYSEQESSKELWFRAEEAYELKNSSKAEKLLLKIVSNDRKNPDSWIKYGIHFMKKSNTDEAIECIREAIRLCSRHKIALLMYGVILANKEEYRDAEIFLKAVTHFFPRFAEGWATLHLLYIKIQYHPGISVTLEFAEKCLKDRIHDETLIFLNEEPIAWSTILCKRNRIFLLTAVLMLKLNLYNFAGLALTQELCHSEKTVEFLYFYSVNAYLHKNYEIALNYLNQAEKIIGLEYSIVALLGHLFYKFGNFSQALKYYENVDMLYERPENIHLVHLRMGFYLIELQEYQRAKNIFSRACRHSPTCKTWLGFGISNYHLQNFKECEIALMEANRIDDEDEEVWAYLCLLSMSLYRYDEFTQCYRQMVKNNLKNDKLWRLITHSMDTLGYSSPITVLEDSSNTCTC